MDQLLDILFNLNHHLGQLIQEHGVWFYAIAFAIIFLETGVVIAPFLPGDSLLFALGAFTTTDNAENTRLNLWVLIVLLTIAGILGDAVNYAIGKWMGPKIFRGEGTGFWSRMLAKRHLDRANAFYAKYGGKAVVLGRFVPIVRTFVPFVAGAGAMNYGKFVFFNIIGSIIWVGLCVFAGHLFGNIPWVKKNFEIVIIGIIVVSLVPFATEWWMHRAAVARERAGAKPGLAGAATGSEGSKSQ